MPALRMSRTLLLRPTSDGAGNERVELVVDPLPYGGQCDADDTVAEHDDADGTGGGGPMFDVIVDELCTPHVRCERLHMMLLTVPCETTALTTERSVASLRARIRPTIEPYA